MRYKRSSQILRHFVCLNFPRFRQRRDFFNTYEIFRQVGQISAALFQLRGRTSGQGHKLLRAAGLFPFSPLLESIFLGGKLWCCPGQCEPPRLQSSRGCSLCTVQVCVLRFVAQQLR